MFPTARGPFPAQTKVLAMNKLIAVLLATMSLVSTAQAQATGPTYADVLRTCGLEWRESETKKTTPRGEGAAAWNKFRAECVTRKGYVARRNRTPADFQRVPDKS
jgi:hypothetical protein